MAPSIPLDERERQRALDDLRLLDTPQEERFDRIVQLVQLLFVLPEIRWSKGSRSSDFTQANR